MNLKEYIQIQIEAMKENSVYEAEFEVHLDQVGMVNENYNGNRVKFSVSLERPRRLGFIDKLLQTLIQKE